MLITPELRQQLVDLGFPLGEHVSLLRYKRGFRSCRPMGVAHGTMPRIHVRGARGNDTRGVIEFSDARADANLGKFQFVSDGFSVKAARMWLESAKAEHDRLVQLDAAYVDKRDAWEARRNADDAKLIELTGRSVGRYRGSALAGPNEVYPTYDGATGAMTAVEVRVSVAGSSVEELARLVNAVYAATQLK